MWLSMLSYRLETTRAARPLTSCFIRWPDEQVGGDDQRWGQTRQTVICAQICVHAQRSRAKARRSKTCLRDETYAQRRKSRPHNAKNRPKIGLSAGRSSAASFGGLDGGRTRAQTWDPLIKRHAPIIDFASKFFQLNQNPIIRYQWLTAKNPTARERTGECEASGSLEHYLRSPRQARSVRPSCKLRLIVLRRLGGNASNRGPPVL